MKKIFFIFCCTILSSPFIQAAESNLGEVIRNSDLEQFKQLAPASLSTKEKSLFLEFAKEMTVLRKKELKTLSCPQEQTLLSSSTASCLMVSTGLILCIFGALKFADTVGLTNQYHVIIPKEALAPIDSTKSTDKLNDLDQMFKEIPNEGKNIRMLLNANLSKGYNKYVFSLKNQEHSVIKSLVYGLIAISGTLLFALPLEINTRHTNAHKKHISNDYCNALRIEELLAVIPES